VNLGKLGADDPLRVGDLALIPVSEFHSFSTVVDGGGSFVGMKRAKAVVALGPWGAVALDVSGEALSLRELLDRVAGLEERMAEVKRSICTGRKSADEMGRKK
jgi:hypothetical protein